MTLEASLKLGGILALVAANAFFVAAEFALLGARRRQDGGPDVEGDWREARVGKAQHDLRRAVSVARLGISAASLGLGWIGAPAVAQLIEPLFDAAGLGVGAAAIRTISIVAAFLVIVCLHVVLGQVVPKSVALRRPDAASRYLAGPLLLFGRLLGPAVWLFDGAARLCLKLIRAPVAYVAGRAHTPEEIEMIVKQSMGEGVVERDEQAMIEGVFDLTRTVAREVMTPRPDIVSVGVRDSVRDILKVAAESGFSRLPVIAESLDEITGIVVVKDLLSEAVTDRPAGLVAGDAMREAVFVPESKAVGDLLGEMRGRKTHIAVVVDEYGGTSGIVTLEDLLEEIVGEIYDEHDAADGSVAIGPDGSVELDGSCSFDDLLSRLGFELEGAEKHDTVAGYVLSELGRIPELGARVSLGSAGLEVTGLLERRITRVTLHDVEEERVSGLRQAFGSLSASSSARGGDSSAASLAADRAFGRE